MATFALPIKPAYSRALAILLLFVALVIAIAIPLAPFFLMHRHYNEAIDAMQTRLELYRRVAAQAPELQKALEALKAKDGRRFFLKNTAPNLAGAEMQDLLRAAIENNGGRITTIQNSSRDDGRFKQIGVNVQMFANTPNLQKILYAIESQLPYLVVDNMTIRPLNAFRGFKPAPGIEPEVSLQLDVVGFAFTEAEKK